MGSVGIARPEGAFVTGPDPFRDIINGIVQGVTLHNQIQRTQDEHDAMQRTAIQQARENRIQDIMQQAISRPVQNGAVTEQSAQPDVNLGGVSIPMQPITYTRPADKSRTVKYKDPDGNEYQRELMTQEEQKAQQLTLARQGQTDVSGILQRILGMATDQSQPADSSGLNPDKSLAAPPGSSGPMAPPQPQSNMFPGGVFVNPTQIPGILGDYVRGRDNERSNQTKADIAGRVKPTGTFIDDQGHKIQVLSDGSTNDLGKAAAAPVKPVRAVQDDKGVWNVIYSDGSSMPTFQGSVKPAGRAGAGGLTPYQQATKDRLMQGVQERDQATVDKMQQQEQAIHAQKSTLGDAISAADGETIPDPLNPGKKEGVKVNAMNRAIWKNKLDAATKQVEGLQASQRRLIDKWGGQSGAPQQDTPGGPPPARAAAAPKTASAAQVQAFAKANNMSVDQATQLVKKQGYTVSGQ